MHSCLRVHVCIVKCVFTRHEVCGCVYMYVYIHGTCVYIHVRMLRVGVVWCYVCACVLACTNSSSIHVLSECLSLLTVWMDTAGSTRQPFLV